MIRKNTTLKIIIGLTSAATLLLTACGGEGDVVSGAETTELRVGTQAGAELVYGPYFAADQMGYFEEEGIKNNFQNFDSGPLALTSMASGDVDVTLAAWLPNVTAFTQGTDMQVLASLAKGNTTLIAGEDIKSLEDLDGKKVGSPGIGTLHDAALTMMAEEAGITVEHVTGRITNLPIMLRNGEISAFIGWETIASQSLIDVEGAHVLERPVPGNENLEMAVLGEIIRDNPELAQRIVNAVYKGTRLAAECPDTYLEVISERMTADDPLALAKTAAPSVDGTQPRLDSETAEMWYDVAISDGRLDVGKWDSYAAFEKDIWNPTFLDAAEETLADWKPEC